MAIIATRDNSGLRLMVHQERDLQDWFGRFCQSVVWAWLCVGIWFDWGQGHWFGALLFACAFSCFLTYSCFRREVILVSPTSLIRQILLFGVSWSKTEYDNAEVHQLRYFEGTEDIFKQSMCVRFEIDGVNVMLARGAGPADGKEIVALLRAEYPFPPFDGEEEPGSNLLGLRA